MCVIKPVICSIGFLGRYFGFELTMLTATAGYQDSPDVIQFLTSNSKNVQMSKNFIYSLFIQRINNYITKQKQEPSRGLSK